MIGYKFAGVSYDRILEILLFLWMFKSFIRAMKESGVFRSMILILVVFSILRQVGDIGIWAQGSNVTLEAFIRTFVKSSTYIIFFFFVYEGLMRFPKRFLQTFLAVVFLAALLAFFQSPITPFTSEAWNFKVTWFGKNIQSEYFADVQADSAKFNDPTRGLRVAGPYQYSIVYSYALFIPVALSVYLYLSRRKGAYLLLYLFFALVATMTLTRSLILATAIVLLPLMRRLQVRYLAIGIIVGSFLFIYFDLGTPLGILISGRLANFTDDGAVRRDLLALCGLVTVFYHPFGVTGQDYTRVRRDFYEEFGLIGVRDLPSHNGFVNLGFHFTIFGYLVFFSWLMMCRWYYRRIHKRVRSFFLFAFIGYMAQSSFHNSFVFIGDYNAIVLLGLFTAEVQWGTLRKQSQVTPHTAPT